MGLAARSVTNKAGNRILHRNGDEIRQHCSDTLVHMRGNATGDDLVILLAVKHVHQTIDGQQVFFHDVPDSSSQFSMAPRNKSVETKACAWDGHGTTGPKEHANSYDICYVADETAYHGQYQPLGAQQPASPPIRSIASSILIACTGLLLGPVKGNPLLEDISDHIHNRQIRFAV